MHAVRHPRGVGIPSHDVDRDRSTAHQIIVHEARPDQIVRAQQLKRAGHLF